MQKQNAKNCLFWFLGALAFGIIDELVVLLSVLAVLFAVTCGGTLFIVAMIQAVPG
ncbi:hypothetical protein JKG47_10480 [Acidithiobacillus sp. MC6.1]|nr:hypothetical protein [Acidithiobacillus sp. MC6.1]